MMNRRTFLGTTAAVAALLAAPPVLGAARPKVVVIGGGAGGATAARYIAKDSKGAIDVTLIEPTRTYYTCFFSNLYLGGFREFDSLGHTYGALASQHGINVVHDWAVGVDRDARTVTLAGGDTLAYDALVVSPGIDFVEGSVPGWSVTSQNKMPHAYKAGSQTQLLKAQIEAMEDGGTYVMIAPPNPYRCPPGPYERISMVAHMLKQTKPSSKILIFDPKDKFSKMALFQDGWQRHYPGMVEWVGGDFGAIDEVRPDSMEVLVNGDTIKAAVCNVIPAMKAGTVAARAGLTNDQGWCPIVPNTMQSRLDERVYVLGDATLNGDMPKSAFSANSQAKVCAMAVRHALTGSTLFPAKYANTCWSLIGTDDGVKVGASYEPEAEKIAKTSGFISQVGEPADLRQRTYEESIGWYAGITADIFS
ncbi:NAD(P)/FAD-dependent oxidoreductase [Roseospirillum parvum]|uniref:NADPH-dependent 2,4-dienoyl-CoA reductase, sulfur reductase n=1 Tax=Roseospirillum parvum TaxID=83401 RepID=A0A1G8ALG6_9PROT|nr:NAD(P)/FAD-dependent oxidoreductase [Roseospirillum parvum]SDH21616.1 NADPH-dependent 2,4-dienoyl-CoA reductase, sulfur reductase [Roseospirillum parvum]